MFPGNTELQQHVFSICSIHLFDTYSFSSFMETSVAWAKISILVIDLDLCICFYIWSAFL